MWHQRGRDASKIETPITGMGKRQDVSTPRKRKIGKNRKGKYLKVAQCRKSVTSRKRKEPPFNKDPPSDKVQNIVP